MPRTTRQPNSTDSVILDAEPTPPEDGLRVIDGAPSCFCIATGRSDAESHDDSPRRPRRTGPAARDSDLVRQAPSPTRLTTRVDSQDDGQCLL